MAGRRIRFDITKVTTGHCGFIAKGAVFARVRTRTVGRHSLLASPRKAGPCDGMIFRNPRWMGRAYFLRDMRVPGSVYTSPRGHSPSRWSDRVREWTAPLLIAAN